MTFSIPHLVSLPDSPGRLAHLIETEIISGMEECLSASEIATHIAEILVLSHGNEEFRSKSEARGRFGCKLSEGDKG